MVTKKMARKFQRQARVLASKEVGAKTYDEEDKKLRKQRRLLEFVERESDD